MQTRTTCPDPAAVQQLPDEDGEEVYGPKRGRRGGAQETFPYCLTCGRFAQGYLSYDYENRETKRPFAALRYSPRISGASCCFSRARPLGLGVVRGIRCGVGCKVPVIAISSHAERTGSFGRSADASLYARASGRPADGAATGVISQQRAAERKKKKKTALFQNSPAGRRGLFSAQSGGIW